jgi:hypothetical protein
LPFRFPASLSVTGDIAKAGFNGKAFSAHFLRQAKNAGGSKAGREQSSVTTPDKSCLSPQFRHKNP